MSQTTWQSLFNWIYLSSYFQTSKQATTSWRQTLAYRLSPFSRIFWRNYYHHKQHVFNDFTALLLGGGRLYNHWFFHSKWWGYMKEIKWILGAAAATCCWYGGRRQTLRRYWTPSLSVFFLFNSPMTGIAIKCWECRSDSDPKCADPFDNSTLSITDCKQVGELGHLPGVRPTMCRKTRQKGKLAFYSSDWERKT